MLIAETAAFNLIHSFLVNKNRPVTLQIGRYICKDICKIKQLKGSMKADFALINSKDEEVFYITHKANNFSYNGYGSVGSCAYPSKSPYRLEDIWCFAKWCYKQLLSECSKSGGMITIDRDNFRGYWAVPSQTIQNYIVYGPEFGNSYSYQNCNVAAVGTPIFEEIDQETNTWRLLFHGELTNNGEVPKGDNEPIICVAKTIGKQKHILWIHEKTDAIKGWIGVFPYRAIKNDISKTRHLVQVDWNKIVTEIK